MVTTIQSSFNAGELSPRMLGRTDVRFYYTGLQKCENFIPFVQGGLTKRTGTQYVAEVKDSNALTRLVPFQFSTVQNYILEFGNLYFRIYRNRGRVESPPGTPVEVVTPWTTAQLRDLKFTQSADTLYVFHPDHPVRKITRTSDTAWTLTQPTFTNGPWMDQNATTTTLTPSATSGTVTITASATTGINGGAGFQTTDVGRLIRIKHGASWGTATITVRTSSTVVTATTSVNFGAITGSAEWRLGAFSGTTGYPAVGTFHEERLVLAGTRAQPQTIWGSKISDFENFAPDNNSGTIADDDGFNFTISDDQVNAIYWLSSGRLLDIGTSGAEHTMSGGTINSAQPITPTNVLIKRQTSYGSVSNVRPVRVGNSVLFITSSRQVLRQMTYNFEIDSYVAKDLIIFSENILRKGVVDFDFQHKRERVGWMVLADGQMVSISFEPEQEVAGFARHIFGGTNAAGEAVAVISSPDQRTDDVWVVVRRTIGGVTRRYVEFITSPFYEEDNGAKAAQFLDSSLVYDGYYASSVTASATTGTITLTAGTSVFSAADVGKQFRAGAGRATITGFVSGTVLNATVTTALPATTFASQAWSLATSTFSGLSHLNGQSVGVWADASVQPNETVSGGSFTLDQPYSYVVAGLNYNAVIETMPEEVPQIGTLNSRKYRIHRFFVRVLETSLLRYRNERGEFQLINFRPNNLPYGEPPALENSISVQYPVGDSGYARTLTFASTDPSPATILFIVKEFVA